MTPYFWECTNVPTDPYFEHGRGTPLSLQIGSAFEEMNLHDILTHEKRSQSHF